MRSVTEQSRSLGGPSGNAGRAAMERAARQLASRLPSELEPLARLAYNYWWSWAPDGTQLFRSIDPHRFELCRENPVRLLMEAAPDVLESAASDHGLLQAAASLDEELSGLLEAARVREGAASAGPTAFFCLEYGIHPSLPVYSGGLGVLAGDILKESSDLGVPMVGMGLMYSQGSYRQRLDAGGWQHDYWVDTSPEVLPAVLVPGPQGDPLTISVAMRGRDVTAQVWRIDVGAVPLFLLDTNRPDNEVPDRWITSRLYVGDRKTRLAQYALLGIGGIRALRALGIDPGVVHLNEGHPALAPVELAAEEVAVGESPEDALARATARTAFTTHTPLPAGNETYSPEDALSVLGSLPQALGMTPERFLALGRSSSEDGGDFGMTTLALRLSRSRNGVSRRHGEVARAMWQPLFGEDSVDDVPIGHVTNGVHVATWMAPPIRELLARHLGATWSDRAADPESWDGIERVPDEELWAVRTQLRRDLVALLRERTANDRLARGESSDHVLEASRIFDPEALTIGFARRVALYKRIYLLVADTERAGRILHGPPPVQFVLGGKAHPDDEEAKRALQGVFASRWGNGTDLPVAYLEDYDIGLARHLVAGCDLWLNLPRAPLEASGTSGMKAALNGGVNLSVLDGWWAEAFDGTNGWGIDSDMSKDPAEQDRIDAEALYRLLESEVVPLFHDRDEAGVPRAWLARVKASMRTAGAEFSATRMMRDYVSTAYLAAGAGRPGR